MASSAVITSPDPPEPARGGLAYLAGGCWRATITATTPTPWRAGRWRVRARWRRSCAPAQRMAAREKDREYERAWDAGDGLANAARGAGSIGAGQRQRARARQGPTFSRPRAWRSVYVIGYDANAMRTFKVDRIVAATYRPHLAALTISTAAPARQLLGRDVGGEREQVVLRFDATASRRVHETHWHPSQQLTALPDGGCELRLELANPQEMLYWIRGWGPQVEVLAPEWLRAEVAADAEAAAGRYRGTVS